MTVGIKRFRIAVMRGALDGCYWRLTIGASLGVVNVLCVSRGRQCAFVLLFRRCPRLEGVVHFGKGGINGLTIGHAARQVGNRHQKAAAFLWGKRLDVDGVVLQFQCVTSAVPTDSRLLR